MITRNTSKTNETPVRVTVKHRKVLLLMDVMHGSRWEDFRRGSGRK